MNLRRIFQNGEHGRAGPKGTRVPLARKKKRQRGVALMIAIISIAALSFLGFGAAPPQAEWGTLVSTGRNFLVTAPWVCLMPGLFFAVTVLSLNHISKTLQELER